MSDRIITQQIAIIPQINYNGLVSLKSDIAYLSSVLFNETELARARLTLVLDFLNLTDNELALRKLKLLEIPL